MDKGEKLEKGEEKLTNKFGKNLRETNNLFCEKLGYYTQGHTKEQSKTAFPLETKIKMTTAHRCWHNPCHALLSFQKEPHWGHNASQMALFSPRGLTTWCSGGSAVKKRATAGEGKYLLTNNTLVAGSLPELGRNWKESPVFLLPPFLRKTVRFSLKSNTFKIDSQRELSQKYGSTGNRRNQK